MPIVDWIGFNPATFSFVGNPSTTQNWFASTDAASIPAPGTPGTTQSLTISTGTSGLLAANFSVKAYVSGTVSGNGPGSLPGVATTLAMVSGNGQTGKVGQQPTPFTVMVTDANGNPVSGTSVTFAVTAGGGTLTSVLVSTSAQGLASATLTMGPNAGGNTVTAASAGLSGSPVTFSATGTPTGAGTAATLVAVSGNGQTGTVGQQLANALTVEVTDANGNPVSGTSVSFAVTGGAGSLSATSVLTNAQGLAATFLTLGGSPGTNTVAATSGALAGSPVNFTATGLAGRNSKCHLDAKQSSNSSYPGYNAWLTIPYDPVSKQTILYGILPTSNSNLFDRFVFLQLCREYLDPR